VLTRLLLLLAMPLTLLTAVAVGGARFANNNSNAAQIVASEAQRSARLLSVYNGLMTERTFSGAIAAAREYRLSTAAASKLYGVDLVAAMHTERHTVDNLIATSRLDVRLDDTGIQRLRARIDGGGATERAVLGYFSVQAAIVRARWNESLDRIGHLGGTQTSAAFAHSIQALRDAGEATALGWDRYLATSSVALPSLSAAGQSVADVAAATALYQAVASRLPAELDAASARAWQRDVVIDQDARVFERLVASTLATRPASTRDLATIARDFHSGVVLQDHLSGVASLAQDHVRAVANAIRESARNTLQIYLAAAVAIIAVTVGVAAIVARSMTRPLRRLSARAQEVSSGRLDAPALEIRGPREVAAATRAFNDATANLGHLYAGVVAMAAGDLGDSAVSSPPEGALGRTLSAAVTRLSQSMRESRTLQDQLKSQAIRDDLTGLANRRLLVEQIDAMLRRSVRTSETVSIVYLDLDGFKAVNDTYGHATGDLVLKTTAERLTRASRGSDLVGRLGGDEFVVVATSGDPRTLPLRDRIVASLSAPIDIGNGQSVRCPASLGIADSKSHHTVDSLLDAADAAMYEAKQRGRETTAVKGPAPAVRATR